ncbi:hypothetical protein [Phascolarctobacterium succinatutens]|uniref:hypothetical protein n=1 Tax=Phascolarctobacterium succinatutens TaxID=626940 RepID=UPI0026EB5FAE|nr:hypothetical protein [Phascolarctobacterium succinatutens]
MKMLLEYDYINSKLMLDAAKSSEDAVLIAKAQAKYDRVKKLLDEHERLTAEVDAKNLTKEELTEIICDIKLSLQLAIEDTDEKKADRIPGVMYALALMDYRFNLQRKK